MLKVFLASLVLLVIAGIGFGIRRLFDKEAPLPQGSCKSAKAVPGTSCGCGGDSCHSAA